MASSSSQSQQRPPLKQALDPVLQSTEPSVFQVAAHTAKSMIPTSWTGTSEGAGAGTGSSNGSTAGRNGSDRNDTSRHFADLAPMIMNPRVLNSIGTAASSRNLSSKASSSSSVSSSLLRTTFQPIAMPSMQRKKTSTSLQIVENAPALLSFPVPESSSSASVPQVSFLRGFQATIPSSEKGKQRRRKVRGVIGGDEELGKLGLKKLGMQGRGLLTSGSGLSDEEDFEQNEHEDDGVVIGRKNNVTSKERRKMRRINAAKRAVSGAGGEKVTAKLTTEELVRMQEEIELDRENIVVRRSILNSEVQEVANKIMALEKIRASLEDGLLKLKEEDLELEDELAGVLERITLGFSDSGKSLASPATPSRRRKGPAFLPSEHDDLPHGVAFMTLSQHSAPITSLDFNEPYGMLITASQDSSVVAWDLMSGESLGKLRGHKGIVKCVQSDGGDVVLTGGEDGAVKLWDLRNVEDFEDSRNGNDDDWVGVNSSLGGSIRGGLSERDEEDGEEGGPCIKTLEGHSKAVTALHFEDSCLITGSSDKTLRQWDVNTGQCVQTMDILWAISHPLNPPMTSSLYSEPIPTPGGSYGLPGASLLNVGGTFSVPTSPASDGSWEMYQDFVGGVQFWGYALASGSGDGGVRMWDMRTGQAHRTLVGHTGPVTCIQFDELHIISGSLDKTIRIWDLRTGGVSDVLRFEYPVTDLQFDSRKIVACTGENGVQVHNRVSSQNSVLMTNGHTKPATTMRYIDKYMVSGGNDSVVKVWSM